MEVPNAVRSIRLSFLLLFFFTFQPLVNAEINVQGNIANSYDDSDPWNTGNLRITGINNPFFGGSAEAGLLEITSGSVVNSDSAEIGDIPLTFAGFVFSDGPGNAIVRDIRSQWNNVGEIVVNDASNLSVLDGGYVSSGQGLVNQAGSVIISGNQSTWFIDDGLEIAGGMINIQNGGKLSNNYTEFSFGQPSNARLYSGGIVNVSGVNSEWQIRDTVIQIGDQEIIQSTFFSVDEGSITISDGGKLDTSSIRVRGAASSINVMGSSAIWNNRSHLTIDEQSDVSLTNGAVLNVGEDLFITRDAKISIDESEMNVNGQLIISNENQSYYLGQENIEVFNQGFLHLNDGTVSTKSLYMPEIENITGTGVIYTEGLFSNLDLVFAERSSVNNGQTVLTSDSTSQPIRDITIDYSSFLNVGHTGQLGIGIGDSINKGTGSLLVADGNQIWSGNAYLGSGADSNVLLEKNHATVTGNGSTWNVSGTLLVGFGRISNNELNILNGGSVVSNTTVIGNGFAGGTATISGINSSLTSNEIVLGGSRGSGQLDILDGAQVTSEFAHIVAGNVRVSGNNTSWRNTDTLMVGFSSEYVSFSSEGNLLVANSGSIEVGSLLSITDRSSLEINDATLYSNTHAEFENSGLVEITEGSHAYGFSSYTQRDPITRITQEFNVSFGTQTVLIEESPANTAETIVAGNFEINSVEMNGGSFTISNSGLINGNGRYTQNDPTIRKYTPVVLSQDFYESVLSEERASRTAKTKVDGLLQFSEIVVNGGSFVGNGTVIANSFILNDALISAGDKNTAGTLLVDSNITLSTESSLLVDIFGQTEMDLIDVIGSFNFSPDSEIIFDLGSYIPQENIDYLFLTATDLIFYTLFSNTNVHFSHAQELVFDWSIESLGLGDKNGLAINFENVSMVPIPSSIWLFGTALMIFGGIRKKSILILQIVDEPCRDYKLDRIK